MSRPTSAPPTPTPTPTETTMTPHFTYGLELEWTEWDRSTPIPPELAELDEDEVEVCNQDGSPYGKGSEGRGGELCVTPSDSIDEAVEKVAELREIVGAPGVSHRCYTHVHIAYPGLAEDVSAAIAVLRYTIDSANADALETLAPAPPAVEGLPGREGKIARDWKRRSNLYARSRISALRIPELLAAETPEEFYEAHYPPRRDGKGRAYGVTPRYSVNLRSLRKHGTIEFRTFGGTTEPEEIRELLEFATRYVEEALSDDPTPVADYVGLYSAPAEIPFDLDAEVTFRDARALEALL